MGNDKQPAWRKEAALLGALCAFILMHAGAAAQPSDREKAIAHYNQGEAYFKTRAFEKAAAEYEKAYALEAQPGLLFNIGLAWENAGATQKALDSYAKYLEIAPTGNKATEARARRAALQRALDAATQRRLVIEGHRTKANELVAQGMHLKAVAELRALHELQGDNTVLFEIAVAFENADENDLAVAAYTRYIETGHPDHTAEATRRRRDLKEKMARKPDPGNGNVIGTPPPPPPDRPSIAWPLVATGVGALALGTGIVLGLRSSSIESDLDSGLEGRNPPLDNSDPRIGDGRAAAQQATGAFVVSGVAAGVAGFLWFRYLRARGETSTVVAPTGNGVAIGGSF